MAVEVVVLPANGVTGFGLNAAVTPGVEDVSVIGELSPLREPTVIVVVLELPTKILIDVGELIEKSWTLTLNWPVPVFPCASVVEQVTVVIPKLKIEPEAGEQETGTGPSTRSVAVGEYVTIAVPELRVAGTVMSAGRLKTGGVLSRTVTVEDSEAKLLDASLAMHLTVVSPSGKVEPEIGEQVGVNDPLTMSVADAEKVATAPVEPVASNVAGSPDIVTVGAVVSTTFTMNPAFAPLCAKSVAIQMT